MSEFLDIFAASKSMKLFNANRTIGRAIVVFDAIAFFNAKTL